ncbi:hypothetical protein [Ectopseudomonas khazarica]|uniref:hypothetical protein n=1 Tax=Ectopseudomonas khazarica TaxID=2502979 RepID=UPI00258E476E|nr:hypothetical protein [uncultured Pseudomonas sp.]
MSMKKGMDMACDESASPDEDQEFSAYGWVSKVENPFTFDNPKVILDYLVESAPALMQSKDTAVHATELLHLVDRFMAADAEYREENSENGYRKALVAMFMLGASARSAQEEKEFPSRQKLKALQQQIGQNQRFIAMQMANKDKVLGSRAAKSVACDYARIRWNEDTEKKIRTGEMTEIVWAWMAEHPYMLEHRPETMEGLKVWIREVASDFPHAQKRGPKGRK